MPPAITLTIETMPPPARSVVRPAVELRDITVATYLTGKFKRVTDVMVGGVFLVLALPLMVIMWAVIAIVDGGPVIFLQERIGWKGRQFIMPKFRTLRRDAPTDRSLSPQERKEEATHLGLWLRRSCMDELPQLFSVVLGHMSLVGPRPEVPAIAAAWSDIHISRLLVRPGLTGMWQVLAPRDKPIHERIEYDLQYLKDGSFWMDVRILLKTIGYVFKRKD